MQDIKNIFFICLSFFLLTACSGSKSSDRLHQWMLENGKVKILSTTAQIGDLVAFVGGNRIDHLVLIKGNLDPHSYELVKGDGEKLSRADWIFFNGLGLEHGASLSSFLQSRPNTSALGDAIAKNFPHRILRKDSVSDPHLWMDVGLWKEAISLIEQQLAFMDPEGAVYYHENSSILKQAMETKHEQIYQLLHELPSEKRYVVTSHDAFRYFARSYLADPEEVDWEMRVAAPEGLAPDGQLSSFDIQHTIQFLKDHSVSVLFTESNVSKDAIQKVISSGKLMGLNLRICQEVLYGDAMGSLSYLEMMQHNADVLREWLE